MTQKPQPSQHFFDQALALFLKGRDVLCPHCGYNLRDLASARCPECGLALTLSVGPQPGRDDIWRGALIATLFVAGIVLWSGIARGFLWNEWRPWAELIVVVPWMLAPFVPAAICAWRASFTRMSNRRQWLALFVVPGAYLLLSVLYLPLLHLLF